MEKVTRDGKVAVLVSPGFGAGWYSWNTQHEELLFHPKLVELVECGNKDLITEDWVSEELGINDVYCGGAKDLVIMWLSAGTSFTIDEYDGSESITTNYSLTITA